MAGTKLEYRMKIFDSAKEYQADTGCLPNLLGLRVNLCLTSHAMIVPSTKTLC